MTPPAYLRLIVDNKRRRFKLHPETEYVGEFLVVNPSLLFLRTRYGFCTGAWNLTHRPSGFAVRVNICCKASAVALAKALLSFDWNFTRQLKSTNVALPPQFDAPKALAIIHNWECPNHCQNASIQSPAQPLKPDTGSQG